MDEKRRETRSMGVKALRLKTPEILSFPSLLDTNHKTLLSPTTSKKRMLASTARPTVLPLSVGDIITVKARKGRAETIVPSRRTDGSYEVRSTFADWSSSGCLEEGARITQLTLAPPSWIDFGGWCASNHPFFKVGLLNALERFGTLRKSRREERERKESRGLGKAGLEAPSLGEYPQVPSPLPLRAVKGSPGRGGGSIIGAEWVPG